MLRFGTADCKTCFRTPGRAFRRATTAGGGPSGNRSVSGRGIMAEGMRETVRGRGVRTVGKLRDRSIDSSDEIVGVRADRRRPDRRTLPARGNGARRFDTGNSSDQRRFPAILLSHSDSSIATRLS